MKYLRSSISSLKPPRPITAKAKMFQNRPEDARLRPMYYSYEYEHDDFEVKPTIPKTHMPRDALKQQVTLTLLQIQNQKIGCLYSVRSKDMYVVTVYCNNLISVVLSCQRLSQTQ